MGDQQASGVDDVGAAGAADLDARDHVPDEFQIDLGDGHPLVAAPPAEAESEVGLGFAPEIDRAQIAPVGARLPEPGIVGQILAAADHVHGEPRHHDLLVTLGVDIGDLGDRRGLAQQAE